MMAFWVKGRRWPPAEGPEKGWRLDRHRLRGSGRPWEGDARALGAGLTLYPSLLFLFSTCCNLPGYNILLTCLLTYVFY